ncbi:disulfide oxidoreductase [Niallia sp. 01092]|uniref:disulfide oxidoreductase n=1 Tax=unclassified Niallia TaxID=2837522 RepID=UPI003FD58892
MQKNVENLLLTAFCVALIAMFGSLYLSEVLKYEPCKLCWFQRIMMYPQVLILGVAIVRKETSIALYTSILSSIGIIFSTYHYLTQQFTLFQESSLACGRVSCTDKYINWFGFITIPFLALIAFIIILIASLLILKRTKG